MMCESWYVYLPLSYSYMQSTLFSITRFQFTHCANASAVQAHCSITNDIASLNVLSHVIRVKGIILFCKNQWLVNGVGTKLAFRRLMWILQLWYTEWSSSGQTTPNSPCIIPYSIRNAHSNMPFLLILVFEIGHWEHNSCDDWCASIVRCLIADILSTAIHAGCFPTLWYTYWVWAKLVLCVTCPALLLLPSSLPALFALVFCYFGYCPDSSREKSIHIDSLFSCSKRVCLSISLL